MLSKEQANTIANDILRDACRSKENKRGWMSAPVPLFYKCKELSAIEPRMRQALIRKATNAVTRDPLFVLGGLVWIGCFVLVGLYGAERLFGAKNTAVFFVACGLVPLICKGFLVRHEIRKIAAELDTIATSGIE